MIFRELAVLLPCHSLEDFPLYYTGDDADSLLACWTSLWHPALVASTGSGLKWHRVDLPPEDLQEKLILVPTVSTSQLPSGFAQRASESGAVLIRQERDRSAILKKALGRLDAGFEVQDSELISDFLALGYGYLQIQVLTRQMRYSSNLDETHFFNQVVAGARAAVAGQTEEARSKIAACFDLLAEERDHYYSVDAYLVDLTLVADTTLGATLRTDLSSSVPMNLMMSGEVLSTMAEREPDTLQAVLAAIGGQRLGIIGGEYSERPLPLLSCEGILAELRRGRACYERFLQQPVEVYGRRRFGLTPALPAILEKLRYIGALHATMDEGKFPASSQVKSRWQGFGDGAIDAIVKPPLDANKPETFLSLAQKLGESMDSDHVATLCFAHWPGQASVWYGDLQRCARYTPALGKFTTVGHYFQNTNRPGTLDSFDTDRYKSPYLRQAVIRKQPDPVSSVIRYWQRRVAADAWQALTLMSDAIVGKLRDSEHREFFDAVEASDPAETSKDDPRIAAAVADVSRQFAAALPRTTEQPQRGCLILNPFGFSRRIGVETRLDGLPAIEKPIVASGAIDDRYHVVAEVPPLGYVWVSSGTHKPTFKKAEPALAEDDRQKSGTFRLRNEFFEIGIDPVTGAMKTLHDYQTRSNRLSQQLALRMPGSPGRPGDVWRNPDETAQYSVMAVDEVRVTASTAALGEIKCKGRLLDHEGQVVANYAQSFRVLRGSRVVQLDIDLEPNVEPTSDAWNSYYACRFAWNDETATLAAGVNQTRQSVHKQRIEAPLYVDIDAEGTRTTVLTCGIPYHRRVGGRMLDSLLVVRGERERQFRLGIGIDLPQSLPEAIGLLAPPTVVEQIGASPTPAYSWLFHLDTRSVTPTHWSLISDHGNICGVRVRLVEASGRSGRVKLSAFRPFTSARQINFVVETLSECPITDGKIGIDIAAHEWIEVEGRWS